MRTRIDLLHVAVINSSATDKATTIGTGCRDAGRGRTISAIRFSWTANNCLVFLQGEPGDAQRRPCENMRHVA